MISKLIDPSLFREKMTTITARRDVYPGCLGLERYSAEHWVNSHPTNQPCDLSMEKKFSWGYNHVPPADFVKNMSMAPRYALEAYVTDLCVGVGMSGHDRIREYRELYNESPPMTWWGWKFYNDTMVW